jgi:hypothetical protein
MAPRRARGVAALSQRPACINHRTGRRASITERGAATLPQRPAYINYRMGRSASTTERVVYGLRQTYDDDTLIV